MLCKRFGPECADAALFCKLLIVEDRPLPVTFRQHLVSRARRTSAHLPGPSPTLSANLGQHTRKQSGCAPAGFDRRTKASERFRHFGRFGSECGNGMRPPLAAGPDQFCEMEGCWPRPPKKSSQFALIAFAFFSDFSALQKADAFSSGPFILPFFCRRPSGERVWKPNPWWWWW